MWVGVVVKSVWGDRGQRRRVGGIGVAWVGVSLGLVGTAIVKGSLQRLFCFGASGSRVRGFFEERRQRLYVLHGVAENVHLGHLLNWSGGRNVTL